MVANLPGRRRVTKPTPFSRPSIEIGGGVKREWKYVTAEKVREGDTVTDVGTVQDVEVRGGMVVLRNVTGTATALLPDQAVYAFVRATP